MRQMIIICIHGHFDGHRMRLKQRPLKTGVQSTNGADGSDSGDLPFRSVWFDAFTRAHDLQQDGL